MPSSGHTTGALEPDDNLARTIDLHVFSPQHVGGGSPTEPEGLLSTLPALATTLIGFWSGTFVRRRPRAISSVIGLSSAGLLLATSGWIWGFWLPINKILWTSSYVLFTACWAAIGLALCYLVVDIKGWQIALRPFEMFGVNAILVYVGSALLARLLLLRDSSDASWKSRIYDGFVQLGLSPIHASLMFALATVCLWWCVAWVFYWQN